MTRRYTGSRRGNGGQLILLGWRHMDEKQGVVCKTMTFWQYLSVYCLKHFLSFETRLLFIESMSNKVPAQSRKHQCIEKQSLLSLLCQTRNHIQRVGIRSNCLMEGKCQSLHAAQQCKFRSESIQIKTLRKKFKVRQGLALHTLGLFDSVWLGSKMIY